MSGYKRVNFYELCRLCATNQQKEKTHIFQEEGRKIQLQNKIQSCLSLKVCENDFLPKVVCSRCLRTLEECSAFRKECYTSETMLSSYFNNFRYTEDFKKSGKVYIKDTSPKATTTAETTVVQAPPTASVNVAQEMTPYYTLQLPSMVQEKREKLAQPQIVYNLNTIKTVIPNGKPVQSDLGVGLNANSDVIAIAPLIDVDAFFAQNIVQKQRKRKKYEGKGIDDANIIKIDLTQSDVEKCDMYEKPRPEMYAIKIDDAKASFLMDSQRPATVLHKQLYNSSLTTAINVPSDYCNKELPSEPPPSSVITLPVSTFSSVQSLPNSVQNLPSSVQSPVQSLSSSVQNLSSTVQNLPSSVALPGPVQSLPFTINSKEDVDSMAIADSLFHNANPSLKTQQSFNFAPSMPEGAKQDKRHSCDICCKTFKRREHLYQHVKLHTGFRPFKCDNCNKSFMRKEHLLRHMTSHSGQKNFTCNICEKSFSRNDNLLKHKKIHNKQNSFTCEVCQKQFVMEHYYLAHKLTHDAEKCNPINPPWGLLKAA